ncbi:MULTISPECIES: hypothetical protein [unclassified Bradyrhizobium]|uniref:hypothetical protein n=1 Tax=unclassified Bradyrhizobium TaxID=2631580 RepID=UPI002916EEDB|nr:MULTISPECIES: hypothetical protein [unclassified Bradyrhizobium]
MVKEITAEVEAHLSVELVEAIDALAVLSKHFGRETLSAAIGEVSERLITTYVGGERRKRGTRGHDIFKGDQHFEVKARFIEHYGDSLKFDFGKHTAKAHTAYCVAWQMGEASRASLLHVFEVGVPFLLETWATPKQKKYCARTHLKLLKRECGTARQGPGDYPN